MTIGKVIAAGVGIIALILLVLSFVAVGVAVPAWLALVLIGALAVAIILA